MTERTIVQYGVYQFTEEEKQAYRLRVYTQVIRHPENESLNLKYQKYHSFYGYAQLMNGNHVHRTVPLQYESECILEFTQSDNLNTFLNAAFTYGVLQSIANLAVLHGGTPEINPLDPPLYPVPFDRVLFKLFSNTTLLVYTDFEPLPTLEITPALPWANQSDDPVPLSGTQPSANPLDAPYDLPTAPYDLPTADNGETYNPQRPEVGTGTEGQQYRVYVMMSQNGVNIGEWGGERVRAPFSAPFVEHGSGIDRVLVRELGTNTLVQQMEATPTLTILSWRSVLIP